MPELPEVERARKLIAATAGGRRIERAVCRRDPIVYEGVSPARFQRALEGRRVRAVRRRGKHLWMELDRRPWPVFHLGMTGSFRTPAAPPLPLASNPHPSTAVWPPRFTKLRLVLDDGGELAMTNARRLGRIRLRDDPEKEPPVSRLGFDALLDLPSSRELAARMRRRTVPVKALLLDQGFAAGVGNWIADEVLYQAKIDPRRSAASLTPAEVRRLRAKLKSVVETAVRVDADKRRFPRTWLFHHRWGRNEQARTHRGERVAFLTIAGRTTAYVPVPGTIRRSS